MTEAGVEMPEESTYEQLLKYSTEFDTSPTRNTHITNDIVRDFMEVAWDNRDEIISALRDAVRYQWLRKNLRMTIGAALDWPFYPANDDNPPFDAAIDAAINDVLYMKGASSIYRCENHGGHGFVSDCIECGARKDDERDDYAEDRRLDDPRHGQADAINRENRGRG